jgi:hypothetical protein
VLNLADLAAVPAGAARQFSPGEAGVIEDLAQAITEGLFGLLNARGWRGHRSALTGGVQIGR